MNSPRTPELDRMRAVAKKSHAVGEFLDWAREQGWRFARYHQHSENCWEGEDEPQCGYTNDQLEEVMHGGIEKLLATYFEIDLDKVDKEKRALLEWESGCVKKNARRKGGTLQSARPT